MIGWRRRSIRCPSCPAWVALSASFLLVAPAVVAQAQAPDPAAPAEKPSSSPREYVPGLRIDWAKQVVEIDAKVVFRDGPLELLACSARTREHESILVVRPRPLHIYEALGLIGLEPGSPVRYDPATDRWSPPTGERVSIEIRYPGDGAERTRPIEDWLLDAKQQRPPGAIEWVFAGSRTFDEGRFGADLEGTIICLVDFETAIIAPASLHSADNEQLWLAANTKEIPAVGTACTLIVKAAKPRHDLVLALSADGALTRNGRSFAAASAGDEWRAHRATHATARVVVVPASGTERRVVEQTLVALGELGIDRDALVVRAPGESSPTKSDVPSGR